MLSSSFSGLLGIGLSSTLFTLIFKVEPPASVSANLYSDGVEARVDLCTLREISCL